MSPELDSKLCEKYPKIFVNRNAPMTETCMCWGFDHGDGWYNIIDALCENIQNHIDWKNSQRERLLKDNPHNIEVPKEVPQVVADQVKEKFGTLRFYYHGGDDYIRGLVNMAESMSGRTCDVCGKPGTTEGPGWILTLCEEHRNARKAKMQDMQ
jgi:hypothetical protein